MSFHNYSVTLVDQPRRVAVHDRTSCPDRIIRQYLTGPETALLLEISEALLCRWRGRGYGPQPVMRSGRLHYEAGCIGRLAAMPTTRRMIAISRLRR